MDAEAQAEATPTLWDKRHRASVLMELATPCCRKPSRDSSLDTCVHSRVPVPHAFDEKLLTWAGSPDGDVSTLAMRVLAHVSHERVRELAIARVASASDPLGAVQLLKSNFVEGDHRLVEAALRVGDSADDLHGRLMDVLDLFEELPVPEAVPLLCFVVEHTPCSRCRLGALHVLVELDALPAWMVAEAQLDASEEIRELVST